MTILLVGLNHQTAPVELRECFYLSDSALRQALTTLWYDEQYSSLSESVIISTCNRLEIYAVVESAVTGFDVMAHFLAQLHHVSRDELFACLYFLEGRAAIDHLMRVAAGLNSLVLGETQILGQVAHALAAAQAAETVGAHLTQVFTHAIHAGKRARTETDISRHTTSVSHAAALLAERELGSLERVKALVVGAGEMAELAARALQMHAAGSIQIISRTYHHAATLAGQLEVGMRDWSELTRALSEVDLVIAATGAPHTVIHRDDVAARGASARPLLLIDIAVPRDIDDDVREIPGVQLYDIDDLKLVVDHNQAQRRAAVAQVEAIIAHELAAVLEWLHSREVVPVIVDLRRKVQAIAEVELEQALRRMTTLDAHDRQVVDQMVHRIVNKLLHTPTTTLRAHATDGDSLAYAAAVRELFALESSAADTQKETRHG